MRDCINECVDLLNQTIDSYKANNKEYVDNIDRDFRLITQGKIEGLEIAKMILTKFHDESLFILQENDDIIFSKYIVRMAKDIESLKKYNDVSLRPINIVINVDGKKDNNKLSKVINTSFTLEDFNFLDNKVKNLLKKVKGEK
ncbi:hypothetical protein [Clostridium botulinum]|uniref:hypothetical protein n=1 Tax=Clostridium botulinum TaxID=1491 RepID=UPI0004AF3568|nr:hypothetical protein [Clostridium botulinum]MBN3437808.1 hypothetical protein [Clostridium botulinum]QDY27202.1 hypothetical protein CGQ40_21085 [Clostridium botulinum]